MKPCSSDSLQLQAYNPGEDKNTPPLTPSGWSLSRSPLGTKHWHWHKPTDTAAVVQYLHRNKQISAVEEAGRTGMSLVIRSGGTDKSLRSEDDFLNPSTAAFQISNLNA